jgi:hypothetical protein
MSRKSSRLSSKSDSTDIPVEFYDDIELDEQDQDQVHKTAAARTSAIHKQELSALLDEDVDHASLLPNSTKEAEMKAIMGGAYGAKKVESEYHLQRFNRILSPGTW